MKLQAASVHSTQTPELYAQYAERTRGSRSWKIREPRHAVVFVQRRYCVLKVMDRARVAQITPIPVLEPRLATRLLHASPQPTARGRGSEEGNDCAPVSFATEADTK